MEYKNDNKFYFEIEKRIPGHLGIPSALDFLL